jgi:hypothetical protein
MTAPRKSPRLSKRHLLSIAVLAICACTDFLSSNPDRDLPKPLFAVGDVIGPQPVPVSDRSDVPIPWTRTGVGLMTGVPYRIAATGMLTITSNPTWYQGCAPRPSLPPAVGPAGLDSPNRPHAVRVGISTQTTAPSSTLGMAPLSAGAGEVSSYAKGPGVVWVSRPTVIGWSCAAAGKPSVPGWLISGTQEVKAIELEPPKLVADKQLVNAGDTVRFDVQVTWTSNYWISSGWRWVSDTTGSTSTPVGNCARNSWCRFVVRERGHAEVNVNAEGMDLVARSPIIEIATAAVRIQSATGVMAVRPAATEGSSTLVLEVSVVSSTGAALPNRTVELSLDGTEQSGGHQHSGTMPPGSLSSSSVPTGSGGVGYVIYSADVFGGTVQLRGTSDGAASATTTITVRVPGLVELMEAGNVDTIGVTSAHPNNHWGSDWMVNNLVDLSNQFFTQFSQKMQTNDISLPLGGKFDLGSQQNPPAYQVNGSHSEHRVGMSADVRTVNLTAAQQRFIQSQWEHMGGFVLQEGDPVHYHLRL